MPEGDSIGGLQIYRDPSLLKTRPHGPPTSASASTRNLFTAAPPAVPFAFRSPRPPLPGRAARSAAAVACRDRTGWPRCSRGSPVAVAMRAGAVLRLCACPGLRYQQGQRAGPGRREYFYYLDHQGQVRGGIYRGSIGGVWGTGGALGKWEADPGEIPPGS